MLDEDYLALNKNGDNKEIASSSTPPRNDTNRTTPKEVRLKPIDTNRTTPKEVRLKPIDTRIVNSLGSSIVRQIILPAIEEEVNNGKNFTQLRQIYNSMILAVWFKANLKQAFLNQVYTNKSKVNGVNVDDPAIKEKIYKQYLQAYKKGVFNYISEEPADVSLRGAEGDAAISKGTMIARKYFSGGLTAPFPAMIHTVYKTLPGDAAAFSGKFYRIKGKNQNASSLPPTAAMVINLTEPVNLKADFSTQRHVKDVSVGDFKIVWNDLSLDLTDNTTLGEIQKLLGFAQISGYEDVDLARFIYAWDQNDVFHYTGLLVKIKNASGEINTILLPFYDSGFANFSDDYLAALNSSGEQVNIKPVEAYVNAELFFTVQGIELQPKTEAAMVVVTFPSRNMEHGIQAPLDLLHRFNQKNKIGFLVKLKGVW